MVNRGLAFVGAIGLTIASGGALTPVFLGMGISIAGNALIQGSIDAINGTSFWQGFRNGAADGALWGGIFALVGSTIGFIKYAKSVKGGQGTKN